MDRVLVLTDGKAGHENQSRAFVRALGRDFDLIEVHFRSPLHKALSYLLDHLGLHTSRLFTLKAGVTGPYAAGTADFQARHPFPHPTHPVPAVAVIIGGPYAC